MVMSTVRPHPAQAEAQSCPRQGFPQAPHCNHFYPRNFLHYPKFSDYIKLYKSKTFMDNKIMKKHFKALTSIHIILPFSKGWKQILHANALYIWYEDSCCDVCYSWAILNGKYQSVVRPFHGTQLSSEKKHTTNTWDSTNEPPEVSWAPVLQGRIVTVTE